jgi:hypothetical protein
MVLVATPIPRVAILEADVPMPELEAQFGRYGEMFSKLLTAGAKAAALPTPTFTAWDILEHPETYPDPSDFDAILITGSRIFLDGVVTYSRIFGIRRQRMDTQIMCVCQENI